MSNLNEKVEKLKDDVHSDITEIKIDITEIKGDVKNLITSQDSTNRIIQDHVAGDNKIIKHLEPILPQLASMAEDHNFKKQKKKKREEFLKTWKLHITFTASVIGLGTLVWSFLP